jgi:hypothetical protein
VVFPRASAHPLLEAIVKPWAVWHKSSMLCSGAGPVDGPSYLTTAEILAPRATFYGGVAVVMTTRPDAKRQQTPVTDDEMVRFVKALLAETRFIESSGYFWSKLFEALPQLSNDNFSIVIDTPATGERVVLDRKNFMRWLEDKVRSAGHSQAQKTPSWTADKRHFSRWLAVFEARRAVLKQKPKGSWMDAYKVASKRLANTPARGTPRTMRSSYAAIQRKRRDAVEVW